MNAIPALVKAHDLVSIILEVSRLTGLIGSALLLLQVLFLSRFPLIENNISRDHTIRLHRFLGETSFFLIVAHIVAYVYATDQRVSRFFSTLWEVSTTMDGVLIALLGTVFIFAVVGTSLRKAMGKLRYETWHLIHLYSYAGVLLNAIEPNTQFYICGARKWVKAVENDMVTRGISAYNIHSESFGW